jgi:hypothetical protein
LLSAGARGSKLDKSFFSLSINNKEEQHATND